MYTKAFKTFETIVPLAEKRLGKNLQIKAGNLLYNLTCGFGRGHRQEKYFDWKLCKHMKYSLQKHLTIVARPCLQGNVD